MTKTGVQVDPKSVEILRGHLDGVVQEMQPTLLNCTHLNTVADIDCHSKMAVNVSRARTNGG